MSDYQIVVPTQLGFNGAGGAASATQSAAIVPVGFRAAGFDTGVGAGEFVYCQNSNASVRGQFVQIQNGSAIIMDAANSASVLPVGVLAANFTTTGTAQYGWVQINGRVDYARGTNSSIAANVPVYICAGTAGFVVTNAVSGNRVHGVVLPNSYTSSQSASLTVDLYRPFVANFSAGASQVL